jgi:hypothetical protein
MPKRKLDLADVGELKNKLENILKNRKFKIEHLRQTIGKKKLREKAGQCKKNKAITHITRGKH